MTAGQAPLVDEFPADGDICFPSMEASYSTRPLDPGAVASEVARASGIYVSQLFRWRRQLCEPAQIPAVFNPVAVTPEPEAVSPTSPEKAGVIEIEFASGGRMRYRVVCATIGADEGAGEGQAAAMIPVPNGAGVWLAAGHAHMRKGFDGLALLVQEMLKRDPHSGHLFVFRGRRGGLIKVLWHDGQGMCLFAKRLERGRFIWPSSADGSVTISSAQLDYLLEGIDWRMPRQTWRPQAAG